MLPVMSLFVQQCDEVRFRFRFRVRVRVEVRVRVRVRVEVRVTRHELVRPATP